MDTVLSLYQEKVEFYEERVGNCKNGTKDKNGLIYHVVQQTNNRANYFNREVARHRDGLLKSLCLKYKVLPLANVIMPTHTHDLFMADDIEKITKVIRHTNQGTASFIRNTRGNNTLDIFDSIPGYVPIKTREQLFYLLKYLYDNPASLKAKGDFVPYSCFESWEKNYYKPYDKEILEKILDISIEEILVLCKTKSNSEFSLIAKEKYGNDPTKLNNQLFKKDITKEWKA